MEGEIQLFIKFQRELFYAFRMLEYLTGHTVTDLTWGLVLVK